MHFSDLDAVPCYFWVLKTTLQGLQKDRSEAAQVRAQAIKKELNVLVGVLVYLLSNLEGRECNEACFDQAQSELACGCGSGKHSTAPTCSDSDPYLH